MNSIIKVLLVDDNPADRRRVQRWMERLSGWRFEIRESDGIEAAHETLSAFTPDIVFVDYQLGAGTGLDLVRGVAEEVRNASDFILLTGQGDEEVVVQALRAGVVDYLTKDTLSLDLLEHTIRSALQRIQDRRALRQRDAILTAITLAAEILLKSEDWRDGMSALLAALGAAANVRRAAVFQLGNRSRTDDEPVAGLLFEWVKDLPGQDSPELSHPELHFKEMLSQSESQDLLAGKAVVLAVGSCVGGERDRLIALGLHTTLLVPIFLAGSLWGVLRFDERRPERIWSALELDALQSAASILGAVLRRERLEESMRLQATALEMAANAIFITDAEGCFLWANEAFFRITGYSSEEILGGTPRILKSGRHDEAFYSQLWNTIRDGQVWRGEMVDRHKDGRLYFQETTISPVRDRADRVSRFVSVQQDLTLRKEVEERLRTQAEYDPLTGLPNRRLFEDRLIQALALAERSGTYMVLMFVDLDRFKAVNDTLGHDAGDDLLKEAASRISSCVRRSDTVARLGGDEFTVILHNVVHPRLADLVALKILEQLERPFFPTGREAHISGSIGIAIFPDDAREMESLVKCADEAMYRSKRAGRATFHFYDPAMVPDPAVAG